jgi:SAM-dependent methyltransferase
MKMEQTCSICGSQGPHAQYLAREMMFGTREPFAYFECAECGCLQIGEPPEKISEYYPKDYYAHSISPEQKLSNPLHSYALRLRDRYAVFGGGMLGRMLSNRAPEPGLQALQPLQLSREAAILDVGCGNGVRLYTLRELGFSNLLGIDPFIAGDKTYHNGLRIEKKSLEAVSGLWDVIMFHHVFEHMEQPLDILKFVRCILKPSGHCILRIPTVSSFAWRHYRTDWVQLDAPRHFFLHSRNSIERLAEAAGLRVIRVQYDSVALQFWGSEQYRLDVALHDPRSYKMNQRSGVFKRADIRRFARRSRKLNAAGEGDAAAFYLVRNRRLSFLAGARHREALVSDSRRFHQS